MKRREFIALMGGAAAAWPRGAFAQTTERLRRIGVLFNVNEDDPGQQNNLVAFVQVLQQLGWIDGHNLRIDTRWAGGDASAIRRHAEDLVAVAARRCIGPLSSRPWRAVLSSIWLCEPDHIMRRSGVLNPQGRKPDGYAGFSRTGR
jgi:hypothetical protein